MKNLLKTITHLIIIIIMMFSVFSVSYAQKDYTVLVPLPGVSDSAGQTKLQTYLPNMFNLMIGIASVLAFIMIVWGGVTYATSDALAEKAEGRGIIENAVYGLILVIGAWLILYTINPQILNFTLLLPKSNITAPPAGSAAGTPMTPSELVNSSLIAALLGQNDNPCSNGQTTGCVNFNGLPQEAVVGLQALCSDNGLCNIVVTGGTEGGHATHEPGNPVVDLRPSAALNSYLKKINPRDGDVVIMVNPRATYTYETLGGNPGGTSTGNHWHVVFQ